MRPDAPAIVQEQYDRQTCLQAIRGLAERIVQDKLELGRWLNRLKESAAHGQWLADLKDLGFSVRTVQRWMERARAKSAKLRNADALGVCEEEDEDETTSDEQATEDETPTPPTQGQLFQPTAQSGVFTPGATLLYCRPCRTTGVKAGCKDCKRLRKEAGQPEEPPNPPAPVAPPVAVPAAPDIGDAAETVPDGTLLDPEGQPLPPEVASLFEFTPSIEAVVTELRSLVSRLRKLPESPGGQFVPSKHVEKLLRAGWRMVWNHRLDKDNTYKCDGYQDHGCAGPGCSKCKGLGVVPKPLFGEQDAPKPKPRRYRP